jgi:hypothetical protein
MIWGAWGRGVRERGRVGEWDGGGLVGVRLVRLVERFFLKCGGRVGHLEAGFWRLLGKCGGRVGHLEAGFWRLLGKCGGRVGHPEAVVEAVGEEAAGLDTVGKIGRQKLLF